MAIAGSYNTPAAGFVIRNRQLRQVGCTSNRPESAIATADRAATQLLFNPAAIVYLDVRRGTAPAVLRIRLQELGLIDEGA